MKRGRKSVEVFSMSALDLFASGLGAFILLAVLLFPYYNKVRSMQEQTLQAQQQAAESEKATQAARQAQREAQAAEERALRTRADLQETLAQITQVEARHAKGLGEMEALRREIDAAVKFVFLGLGTKKRDFVILVDMSGSMRQYTKIMLETVDRIVGAMSPRHKVAILAFQHSQRDPAVISWPAPNTLLEMTPENKRRAMQHARTLAASFAGTTPTYDGLKAALAHPAASILLLSDGAPFYPRDYGFSMSYTDIANEITRLNGGRKEIHAIALGDYSLEPGLVDFLQRLSRTNGGGFAAISN